MYSVACLGADFLQYPLRSDFERVSLLSLSCVCCEYFFLHFQITLSRETHSYECTPAEKFLHRAPRPSHSAPQLSWSMVSHGTSYLCMGFKERETLGP